MTFLIVLALCGSCHPTEAAAFARSRHAHAGELAIYTGPARRAATPWCATCHRPEGRATAGLTCLTCHRVDGDPGAIRSARLAPTTATRRTRPHHRTVVDPTFARTTCARCHEFATPTLDPAGRLRPPPATATVPLQHTVTELRRADPSARCGDCHDVHRPAGGHDPETVRGAATFSARVVGSGVEISIVASAGHRFPTGDPFRRIVVETCDDATCTRSLGRQILARRFVRRGAGWTQASDTTLVDGRRRVVRLPFGRYWRATLRYGDPRFEARLPPSEVRIELAHGEL